MQLNILMLGIISISVFLVTYLGHQPSTFIYHPIEQFVSENVYVVRQGQPDREKCYKC
jgi:hypothetical protein